MFSSFFDVVVGVVVVVVVVVILLTFSDVTDTSSAYFVGLNWTDMFQADDKIGLAFGQPTTNEDEASDPFAYEVYYSFKPNDSLTVTPAIFGGSDRNGTKGEDVLGYVLETTFKF